VYNLDANYGNPIENGAHVGAYENYSCEESEISSIDASIDLYFNTGEHQCNIYIYNCNY
jgi:hypothetical protein